MRNSGRAAALILALGLVTGCGGTREGNMVDLVLVNGKVWTGDAARPRAEAVAVGGGRILAVGTTAEMRKLSPSGIKLVDLGGALLLPGFIDSHTHFLAGGFALKSIDLRKAKTREDFVARIAAKARELGPGRWVLNGDWDHQQFDPPELPRKDSPVAAVGAVNEMLALAFPPPTITEQLAA